MTKLINSTRLIKRFVKIMETVMIGVRHPLRIIVTSSTYIFGVLIYKLDGYFYFDVNLASLLLKKFSYGLFFILSGVGQICDFIISGSLIEIILSNTAWANTIILLGLVFLYADILIVKKVIKTSKNWPRANSYDYSRIVLKNALVVYLISGLIVIFLNRLANANFLTSILFLWSHMVSLYLLNILHGLNMKNFWIYASVVKGISFVFLGLLNIFVSLEVIYPLIGWSSTLVEFYSNHILVMSNWSAAQYLFFLVPFGHLFSPAYGCYYSVGLGISLFSSKTASFALELGSEVKSVFPKSKGFQSTLLFVEHFCAKDKLNTPSTFLAMGEKDFVKVVNEYNSESPTAHKTQWKIEYTPQFYKQVQSLGKIFSLVEQANKDKEIKLALTGKGPSAYAHYQFCDQNSARTTGVSTELWELFLRGSGYGKLLLPREATTSGISVMAFTLMDKAYNPSTEAENTDRFRQLLKELDTAILFISRANVESIERPLAVREGDAIIKKGGLSFYADFKSQVIQANQPTVLATGSKAIQEELEKHWKPRFDIVDSYFNEFGIERGFGIVLSNKMIAPSVVDGVNASIRGAKDVGHAIAALSPEELD